MPDDILFDRSFNLAPGLRGWLRDHIYIPFCGNRHDAATTVRNLLLTMTLGGLWHGATWNFVFWGLLHGLALVLWRFAGTRIPETSAGRFLGWAATMAVVFVGWFLFRCTTFDLIVTMLAALANWEWTTGPTLMLNAIVAVAAPLARLEWLQRRYGDIFPLWLPRWLAFPAMSPLVLVVLARGRHHQATFIYFQS